MYKVPLLLLFVSLTGIRISCAQSYSLSSPDGRLIVAITTGKQVGFQLSEAGKLLVSSARISLHIADSLFPGKDTRVLQALKTSADREIHPLIPFKNAVIRDHYNQLVLVFAGSYELVFRAYNRAIAYRFITHYPDSINVENEQFDLQLPAGSWFYFQGAGRWMNPYEHIYAYKPLDSLGSSETNQLPMLIDEKQAGVKLLLTEADLYDYPGLYFTSDHDDMLRAIFPPAVRSNRKNIPGQNGWDREIVPATDWNYLSRTSGNRVFPWRILAVADRDADLLDNEIVYQLAPPDTLKDGSWIRPGKVAWDWWNDWNITGVNFRAGLNTATYKYYIDFASRNKLQYIIMDDGWYVTGDLTKVIPAIDMKAIVDYANRRHVGVILWCSWWTLNNQMDRALDLFKKWGIRGIKVDFMDRDDQYVVDFYWRCAAAAAKRHLVVDFHGAHKPDGMMRTYPNILNFEGVPGLEHDKWTDSLTTPEMAVTLPFIRMFAGPMDYTPGAMRNAQKKDFAPIYSNPMSLGTRCQQLAMYVLYDAPLQMLCDNPVAYEREPQCLDFIASVPTTWDSTVVLAAKVDDYLAEARRHGSAWFVGAMTDWNPRDLQLDFSFLPQGNYKMVIFQDGINADRNGTDYLKITRRIRSGEHMTVHLAPGGGWAARITPLNT
ncbi:MAG TPA: glycoside hydrolase family 97 protein [Chitinophagaceae bacterium]|nr:glycoside hydrolase family 97 protein [Chitinophagaceae bacterium]